MDDNPRIAELRKKLEKDPASRLFAQLAEELRKEGRHTDAISVARGGLEKNPNYPSARLTLARALLDSGRPGDARPELEGIVKVSPDNILASRLLGEALEDLGDLKGAVQQIERTLKISPGDKNLSEKLASLKAALTQAARAADPLAAPAPRAPASPVAVAAPRLPSVPVPPPVPVPVPAAAPALASVALDRDLASGTFSPGTLNARDLQKHFDAEGADLPAVSTPPDVDETLGFGSFASPPAPAPEEAAEAAALPPQLGASPQAQARGGDLVPEVPEAPPRVLSAEPPVAEARPPEPADDSDAGAQTLPLTSLTLADLYLQQGLRREATAVLSQVIREEPGNKQAQTRFAAVSRETASAEVVEPVEDFSGPAISSLAEPPTTVPALASGAWVAPVLTPDEPEAQAAVGEPLPAAIPPQIVALPIAVVSAPSRRRTGEIQAETILSLKAFLSAVEREAVHQRATETLVAPTGAPTL